MRYQKYIKRDPNKEPWFYNFVWAKENDSLTTIQKFEKYNIKYNSVKYYLEFESENEYLMFVLKWS